MNGYTAPIDDIKFVVTALTDFKAIASLGETGELTQDLASAIFEEAGRFAAGVLAPLNTVGDRNGASFCPESGVSMPEGFREAYRQYVDAGWAALAAPGEYGGQHLPRVVTAGVEEMWKAANLAFSSNFLLTSGAVEALSTHGSPAQRARYLPRMTSGEWCGVMNLTEPQAGSDLAAIKTRAVRQADGSYRLFGQKCFITYADHDMAENIVHLVLARTPDAPAGVKGISLFVVSKRLIAEDGSLGPRNDVRVASIEKKMGQHASPTCVVLHGETEGAVSELVGEIGAGLAYMFVMVNAARFGVALEGLGIAERSLQQACAYASTRIQGRVRGSVESVPIERHPDVQRMLLTMRAQTEAMRAAAYVAAGWLDLARIHPDAGERSRYQAVVDLMIPVLKGWMTETGAEVASMAIQVHGGAGYVEETGVAQHYRDIRVAAIYEGTTGIQAADLVSRKIGRVPGPEPLVQILSNIRETADGLSASQAVDLRTIGSLLRRNVDALDASTQALIDSVETAPEKALGVSVPYLKALGTLVGGWQMARAASLASSADGALGCSDGFLRRKIKTARHYAEHILPLVSSLAITIETVLAATDDTL